MELKRSNQRNFMHPRNNKKIPQITEIARLLPPVFFGLGIGFLSGCAESDEQKWVADGVAYSINLELSDEVAALAGRQGTQEELVATKQFVDFINNDGLMDVAEQEIVNELLTLEPNGDLRYLYGSQPYADLMAPSPEAKKLLLKLQKSNY